jgi:glyoxylate reductase
MDTLHDRIQPGLVHFMAFPQCAGGNGPIVETIEGLAQDGFFKVLEITRVNDPQASERVRAIAEESGIRLFFGAQPALLGGGLDLNHREDAERARAIAAVRDCIPQAQEMGCEAVAVLSGPVTDDLDDAMDRLVDSLCQLCEDAEAHGLRLVLETFDQAPYGKNRLIGPTTDAVRLSERIREKHPSFGLMLDLSHLPLLNETPEHALRTAGDHLVHIHIGNCAMDDPEHPAYGDNHPRFGAPGTRVDIPELTEFLSVLSKTDYLRAGTQGVVTIEVKPMTGEDPEEVIAESIEALESAWNNVATGKGPRVFVARRIPDDGLEVLYTAFGRENVAVFSEDRPITRAELLEHVQGVEGLLPILTDRVDAEILDAAGPQLKVVANYAVGYNNIDVAAASERGIVVTNTPGVLTETTADLTWAILMATARRLGEGERYLRAGRWDAWGPMLLLGADVHGKTLGIYGMGRIGQAVARRALGFGMKILYTNRNRLPESLESELNATLVDKATLLARSDFLSIHCPFTDETKHAFSDTEFAAMKRSAILINTSRGPVVDEAALVRALHAKTIASAGLDVFEEEPKIHPGLFACENALLIPHLGSATRETRGRMAHIAATNLVAVLEGRTPPNPVN